MRPDTKRDSRDISKPITRVASKPFGGTTKGLDPKDSGIMTDK
jgi:hypothetical protein